MNPVYYESKNIEAYPSSNSVDNGKLMLEENVTEITTKLTRRNFCLTMDDFKLTLGSNNTVKVSPGRANILGYMIHTDSEITVESPDSTISSGTITIGLKLAYDSSDHILGDVGVEGGVKYFNGVYGIWLNQNNITDDTLVLGTATWDGSKISNLKEYEDKCMIFDIDKILVYPGISLLEYIDQIPRKYIHRDGNRAVEIDSSGKDIYNGTGGDVYGDLYFKTSRSDTSANAYGMRIGLKNNKQISEIEIKPLDMSAAQYKVFLGSNHTRSYLKLGSGSVNYVPSSNVMSIEGVPVQIQTATTINNTLTVNTSGIDYRFNTNEYRSTSGTNNIVESHSTNDSTIKFTKTDNSQSASIVYDYTTKKLNFRGVGSTLNFDVNLDASNVNIKNGSRITFAPNDAFINNSSFKIGTTNNYISYNTTGLLLNSNQSGSIKLQNSSTKTYSQMFNSGLVTLHGNSTTASGIKFDSEGSTRSVLLSNQYNTNVLKLTGSFVVDGDVSTINGGKVYNAVYNDYAERYLKDNEDEIIEPGDIVCVDDTTEKYRKVRSISDLKLVVGVCSDTYGFLLGGEEGLSKEELDKKYVSVGVAGRLYVKTDDDSILPGNLLRSDINGKATKAYMQRDLGCIIGKALSKPKNGKVYMQIILS